MWHRKLNRVSLSACWTSNKRLQFPPDTLKLFHYIEKKEDEDEQTISDTPNRRQQRRVE